MRKGWEQRKVNENCMGCKFTRWYIKSPNGNFYHIYRGYVWKTIYMAMDINDCEKSIPIGNTYNEAIKKVYEMESNGTYSKQLSKDVQNNKECKRLFTSNNKVKSYYSY